jgi:dihydrofolate reductase
MYNNMSYISIIAALDEHNAIGKNRQLLCHLPCDMKRFAEITTGHAVIMGRRTFESLPKGALPNRRNVVLTSQPAERFPGATVCRSMHDALELCAGEAEIFMIGGATVYAEALEIADRLCLTRIHHVFEDADVFFPPIPFDEWIELTASRRFHVADEKHAYSSMFHIYLRKRYGNGK